MGNIYIAKRSSFQTFEEGMTYKNYTIRKIYREKIYNEFPLNTYENNTYAVLEDDRVICYNYQPEMPSYTNNILFNVEIEEVAIVNSAEYLSRDCSIQNLRVVCDIEYRGIFLVARTQISQFVPYHVFIDLHFDELRDSFKSIAIRELVKNCTKYEKR